MKAKHIGATVLTTSIILAALGLASGAEAQSNVPVSPQMVKVLSVVVPPPSQPGILSYSYSPGVSQPSAPPVGPTGPMPPVVTVTPPPVVTPPPTVTPPPVVTTVTPTPRVPDRPGMFNNLPSDMRSVGSFGQLTSINSLMTAPGAIDLSLPRQAVPNMLENRPTTPGVAMVRGKADAGTGADQLLDNAKPLL